MQENRSPSLSTSSILNKAAEGREGKGQVGAAKASPTGEPVLVTNLDSSFFTSSSSFNEHLMDPSSRALSQHGNGGFSNWQLMALKHPWSGARLVPMAANIQWLLYDCGDDPLPSSSSSSNTKNNDNSKSKANSNSNSNSSMKSPADAMRGLWVKMLHNEREIPFPACFPSNTSTSSSSSSSSSPPLNTEAAKYGLTMPCPWDVVKAFFRGPVYERYGINTCSPSDWIDMCAGFDDVECGPSDD